MPKMSTIDIDIPTNVLKEVTTLFDNLGLDINTAINIFLKRVIYEKRIPFEIKQQPSKEFIEDLEELDHMESHPEDYKVYHNVDKLFEDLSEKENIVSGRKMKR